MNGEYKHIADTIYNRSKKEKAKSLVFDKLVSTFNTMSSARSSRRSGSTRRSSKSPDKVAGEQPGLRRLVQKRILDDVFGAAGGVFLFDHGVLLVAQLLVY